MSMSEIRFRKFQTSYSYTIVQKHICASDCVSSPQDCNMTVTRCFCLFPFLGKVALHIKHIHLYLPLTKEIGLTYLMKPLTYMYLELIFISSGLGDCVSLKILNRTRYWSPVGTLILLDLHYLPGRTHKRCLPLPIFLLLSVVYFYVCGIISSALQIKMFYGSKHYQPSLLEQSDLGAYCLQYSLPKIIRRRESRQQVYFLI